MENPEMGRLIGVGVGPGDPGLVTVRAVEIIKEVAVIAYPVHKHGASSRALEAVRPYLPDDVIRLPLLMPMIRDSGRLHKAHNEAAQVIIQAASGGSDVAYLSLGDPLFYSTFGYLAERFPGPKSVISGVTSVSAAAAAAGRPLACGDTPAMIVTGPDKNGLESALDAGASIVIMKPRALPRESIDLLESRGAIGRATAALELGGDGEELIECKGRGDIENLPYFSILLIQSEAKAGDTDAG